MEDWLNNTDREQEKYSVKNLPQCYFIHHSYILAPDLPQNSPYRYWIVFGIITTRLATSGSK
jgi:hypothetical protein